MALLPANFPITLGDTQFEVQCKLGNGVFGTVYKVRKVGTQKDYALKDVLLKNSSTIEYVRREIQTLFMVSSHERIVKIHNAFSRIDTVGAHALILMEYLSGGNLNDRLSSPSTDDKNLKWMIQMAEALKFLHANRVVHRDLKADNVLLCDRLNEDIKVVDFGLAREYLASSTSDTSVNYYLSTATGPVHSQAPEVFTRHYTEKADVFSLGIIFHAILGRNYIIYRGKKRYGTFVCLPQAGEVGLGRAMAHLNRNIQTPFTPVNLWRKVPASLRSLIGRMLGFNPRERPSAAEALEVLHDLRRQEIALQVIIRSLLQPTNESSNRVFPGSRGRRTSPNLLVSRQFINLLRATQGRQASLPVGNRLFSGRADVSRQLLARAPAHDAIGRPNRSHLSTSALARILAGTARSSIRIVGSSGILL